MLNAIVDFKGNVVYSMHICQREYLQNIIWWSVASHAYVWQYYQAFMLYIQSILWTLILQIEVIVILFMLVVCSVLKRYCYLDFGDPLSAQGALNALNNKPVPGTNVSIITLCYSATATGPSYTQSGLIF